MLSTYKTFPISFEEWFRSSSTLQRIPILVKQREEKILWQKRLQNLDQGMLSFTEQQNCTAPQVLVLDSEEAQYHVLAIVKTIEKEFLTEIINHYTEGSIAIQDSEWNKPEDRRRIPIPTFTKPIPYRSLPQLLAATEMDMSMIGHSNLVAIDLETDGLGTTSNILQISLIKLHVDKRSRMPMFEDFSSFILPHHGYQVNEKGMAFQVNNISNHTLSGAPLFKDIATEVLKWTDGATLVGFNIHSFDLPILQNQLKKLNASLGHALSIDLAQAFWKYHPRNLQTALYTYKSPMAKDDLHNAYNDAYASLSLLSKMIERGTVPSNPAAVKLLMQTEDNEGPRKGNFIVSIGPSALAKATGTAPSLTPALPSPESSYLKRKRINETEKLESKNRRDHME